MRALDKKLLRDLKRMWAQALAIAMVIAAGVSTLILAVGAYQSLEETRAAYYERHRFADVFTTLTRAPQWLENQLRNIPGVAVLETRISKPAILDITGFDKPATCLMLSLPDRSQKDLNRLYIRLGRRPVAGARDEVVVNEAFAKAHRFAIGDRLQAVLNGKKQPLRIVGIALSPEYIYTIGPGDLMPDPQRFGIIWMSRQTLGDIFDLDGAFNALSAKLQPHASADAVIKRLDADLKRYGGSGAYARKDQVSHAFLDAELKQLQAMARVIPPIFLFVSAFLINMTLQRLIALEREQIGLLKALGYAKPAIAGHYIKFVLAIAVVGIVIGFALGTQFGFGLTRLYSNFFNFPFLIFERNPAIYLAAAGMSAIAAVLGATNAVRGVLKLAPAVAMQPPAPPDYRRLWSERLGLLRSFSQLTMISLRHIIRWPVRAGLTVLGLSLAVSLLVVSLFSLDSVEHMIDVNFTLSNRQDATIALSDERNVRVVNAVSHMPGVMRAEPFRGVLVRMRNGHLEKKLSIYGKPRVPVLARVVDRSLRAVTIPRSGLMVDERVAELLNLRRGDIVEVEILGGWRGAERIIDIPYARRREAAPELTAAGGVRGTAQVPVTDIIRSYFGLSAFMHIDALNRLIDEGPMVSGVHISYDPRYEQALFDAIKATPAIASIAMQRLSLAKFRETLAENISMMVSIYAGLAIIVALGVVYNSARIQLSEQARELASLRVLGFTRAEVSRVLLLELAILVIAAQPLGWGLGYLFSWFTIQGFSSDLYRAPLVVNDATFAFASLVVLTTSALTAYLVRRRIDALDLIAVLKTRE